MVLGVLIVVVAVSLLYSMIHLVPGDPVKTILGPRASPELQAQIREVITRDLSDTVIPLS